MTMNFSSNGLNLTKQAEGYRNTAYDDGTGTLTIGYGHTRGVKKGMKITQAQADAYLLQDVAGAVSDVNRLVKVPINQNQFDALVDFEFNTGSLASSDLLKYLNSKNFTAATNEFLKWNKAHVDGKLTVMAGLTKRREAEKSLFLKAVPVQSKQKDTVSKPAVTKPASKPATTKQTAKPATPKPVYHTVGKGETLSGIATANHTTVANLEKLNGIKDPNKIYVNQRLRVK